MAKKKNQTKKHKFKYSEPTSAATLENAAPIKASTAASPTPKARPEAAAVATRDFSYVAYDLRRISVLVVSLVALEVILWYLFHHTGLGDSVRGMIKL